MLERDQSLFQYYNNIASLQDWYSTDHGSHTPQQDDGDCSPGTHTETRRDHARNQEHRNRQLSALIVTIEKDVQSRVKPVNGG